MISRFAARDAADAAARIRELDTILARQARASHRSVEGYIQRLMAIHGAVLPPNLGHVLLLVAHAHEAGVSVEEYGRFAFELQEEPAAFPILGPREVKGFPPPYRYRHEDEAQEDEQHEGGPFAGRSFDDAWVAGDYDAAVQASLSLQHAPASTLKDGDLPRIVVPVIKQELENSDLGAFRGSLNEKPPAFQLQVIQYLVRKYGKAKEFKENPNLEAKINSELDGDYHIFSNIKRMIEKCTSTKNLQLTQEQRTTIDQAIMTSLLNVEAMLILKDVLRTGLKRFWEQVINGAAGSKPVAISSYLRKKFTRLESGGFVLDKALDKRIAAIDEYHIFTSPAAVTAVREQLHPALQARVDANMIMDALKEIASEREAIFESREPCPEEPRQAEEKRARPAAPLPLARAPNFVVLSLPEPQASPPKIASTPASVSASARPRIAVPPIDPRLPHLRHESPLQPEAHVPLSRSPVSLRRPEPPSESLPPMQPAWPGSRSMPLLQERLEPSLAFWPLASQSPWPVRPIDPLRHESPQPDAYSPLTPPPVALPLGPEPPADNRFRVLQMIGEGDHENIKTQKAEFLSTLRHYLSRAGLRREDLLDLFDQMQMKGGSFWYIHMQDNCRFDRFRLFFKKKCNVQDDENFWHTQTYQTAVKLLKEKYLMLPQLVDNRGADENRFIDYVRGNSPCHWAQTSTRARFTR